MNINNMVTTLQRDIIRAFAMLDSWFDKQESFHRYKPPGESLTFQHATEKLLAVNEHLLSLIGNERGGLKQQHNLSGEPLEKNSQAEHFLVQLQSAIEITYGKFDLTDIREAFREQLYRCLCQLDLLRHGEGALDEGDNHKMNICQLIELLSFNIWKNIVQLEKLERVYEG